jgi:branched-subunit amino acid transport protein AzlD
MTVWLVIAALSVGTAATKAAGPIALGRRRPSQRLANVIALISPSLLAALVVYETVHTGTHGMSLDARTAGVAAATVALLARLPLVAVMAMAVAAAALARTLT